MSNLRQAAKQALEALMWHDEGMRTRADSEAITALRAALAEPREHITDGTQCWCEPELNYVDPDTGAKVWIHKEQQ